MGVVGLPRRPVRVAVQLPLTSEGLLLLLGCKGLNVDFILIYPPLRIVFRPRQGGIDY